MHHGNCVGFVCTCPPQGLFKPGNRIRNRYAHDVDFIVVNATDLKDGNVELCVRYWNRIYKSLATEKTDIVTVKAKDFHNWSVVD